MRRTAAVFCALTLSAAGARGAPSWLDFAVNGYLKELLTLSRQEYGFLGGGDHWNLGNVVHTRQNLKWYPGRDLTCAVDVKTRFFRGSFIKRSIEYAEALAGDATYFDWTWTALEEGSSAIVTSVDRAYVDWHLGPVQSTLGRQRIAWGTNWVWNPTDLFNPISPIDFDTQERPGADAVRIQYYSGPTSKLELALAPNRDSERRLFAGLAKTNVWEYDLYLIGGSERSNAVVGGGWAGQVRGAGFRGELLYTHPAQASDYGRPFTEAAFSLDYTFPNSFFLHGELLYNSAGSTGDAGGERLLEAIQRGDLTPARASLFGEAAYNLSPLVRVNLSSIVNPLDHSWYLGPTVSWSLATNVDLGGVALFFGGREGTEFGDLGEILAASLRFSF